MKFTFFESKLFKLQISSRSESRGLVYEFFHSDIIGAKAVGNELFVSIYSNIYLTNTIHYTGFLCCKKKTSKVYDPEEKKLQTIQLTCENHNQANEWYIRFTNAANGRSIDNAKDLPPKRNILVLLNPQSGDGDALNVYVQAKEMFEKANVDITLQKTERPDHAIDILRNEVKLG